MVQHILFGAVPKIGAYHFIYTGIANNGKLTVNNGYIYQYAVTQLGFVHIQLVKIFGGTVKYIVAASFFNTNPQLARCMLLGILYGLAYALLLLVVKYCHGVG